MVIREPHAQIRQHTHMHKAVTGCVEAKKLFSRRRQSDYSYVDLILRSNAVATAC